MFVDRSVRESELAFLNAPFEANGWQEGLRHLAAATGSAAGQLIGSGYGPNLTFSLISEERSDPHGHLGNPLLYGPQNWRVNCEMRGACSIQHEPHYAAFRSANHTADYDDAISDLDFPYGCQSPLLLDSKGGLVGLALLRSSRDGPCSADVLAIFTRAARQAHRAARVEIALGQARGGDMLAGLQSSCEMTLLLDRHGRLVAMTEAAESLFDRSNGLRLDGLAVHLANADESRSVGAAMTRLLASDELDGPVLHQCRVGRSVHVPEGCWDLFLTRLPVNRDLLGVEARLALTLRPIPLA